MENSFNFLSECKDGLILTLKLVPNSSFSRVVNYTDDFLRIKISAPAVENKANKELINFCSNIFCVNKSKLSIISGEKSKLKKVLIKDVNVNDFTQKLMFVLDSVSKEK